MKFPYIQRPTDLFAAHVVYSTYYPINEFYSYCKKEFATENFEFVMLARTFHPALGPAAYDFFPATIATFTDRARYIYLGFIREDAPKVINIDAEKRNLLHRAYQLDEWEADAFDQAHKEILEVLERDTFRRFQDWPESGTPGINIAASKAARAARATNAATPAVPVLPAPPAPPVVAAPVVAAPALQPQMPAPQGSHRPMVPVSRLPLHTGPAVPAVPASRPLPAVVVVAPPAVVDRAREIERELPRPALAKANGPVLVIRQIKLQRPPLPQLPASVAAKKKPVPPVPVFPNKPK